MDPVQRAHVGLAVEEDREVLAVEEVLRHEGDGRVVAGQEAVEHRGHADEDGDRRAGR